MTTSVVAVTTDVIRNGRPVVGYAFNSTGAMPVALRCWARFIPRIISAPPQELLDQAGLSIQQVLGCMMQREKPAATPNVSVPIGTIETAVWDALAKILDVRSGMWLAERF